MHSRGLWLIWNNKVVTIAQESQYSIDRVMKPELNKDLITEDGNLMTLNVFQQTFGIKAHFFSDSI